MGKVITLYLNNDDLLLITDFLSENNAFLYNEKKVIISEAQAISNEKTLFYVSCNQDNFIEFTPCFYTLNRLQPAMFCIRHSEDPVLLSVFMLIKKYIRRSYLLAQDKSYYIGPGIYKDWLNEKYCFPVLFRYDQFVIHEKNYELLLNNVLKEGYSIKANNARLRDIDSFDFGQDSFVICAESSKLLSTIINRSIIRYEYGSDCIFAYRNKGKREYIFVLDKRVNENANSTVRNLFETMQKTD